MHVIFTYIVYGTDDEDVISLSKVIVALLLPVAVFVFLLAGWSHVISPNELDRNILSD